MTHIIRLSWSLFIFDVNCYCIFFGSFLFATWTSYWSIGPFWKGRFRRRRFEAFLWLAVIKKVHISFSFGLHLFFIIRKVQKFRFFLLLFYFRKLLFFTLFTWSIWIIKWFFCSWTLSFYISLMDFGST